VNASEARIGVVGATGAVGTVTLRLLRERGYRNVRAFASARSAGRELEGGIAVEEATPDVLAAGGLDLALFSCGTSASRELVPHAVEGGALVVDKSSAYRLVDGYPLVVPEVNSERAVEALETTRVVANPNCSTIPLACVLKPLHDAAGLRRVRLSTYQAVSGAGAQRMERLRAEPSEEHDLAFDWTWEGDETDEEAKIRAETRKILELPELPLSATTVRVPVLVGHSQSVWVETEEPLSPEQAESVLAGAPGVRLAETPTSRAAAQTEDVLVGRLRPDRAAEGNGLVLFLACDNLVKGAALNALQIAELLLEPARAAAR
jgi:aspartate-semialdehyde dehydrogenase